MCDFNKRTLANDLTEAFIAYQYRLDHPVPSRGNEREEAVSRYLSDTITHAKVKSLVSWIMMILDKHVKASPHV